MGMFDYIRVEYPMPDQRLQNHTFQTKDTPSQILDSYCISADGKLLHEAYEIEVAPVEERHGYKRYLETGDDIFLISGMLRRINKRWVDTLYHGDIIFYGFEDQGNINTPLLKWQARFTNGQLEWIKAVQTKER